HIDLANVGIASSGDTFRFVEIDSVRYSHLIDPRSGKPLTTHRVVSIVAKDATTADALASAVSVLGPKEGLPIIKSLPGTEALIFQWNGKGDKNAHETFCTPLFKPFVK
ncbi:MAG: FAD:protein FMN transferase, partial [Planctomycetia bacterium]|nr:FAD:protein FMN transferase [Planctomycetia bacterium]